MDPVLSPTGLLTQTLTIRLGRGRAIAVSSEAGSVTITGTFGTYTPTLVTVPLLLNVTHHLLVTGTVEYAPGCFYHLSTRDDRYGQPLVIFQQMRRTFLPVVIRQPVSIRLILPRHSRVSPAGVR